VTIQERLAHCLPCVRTPPESLELGRREREREGASAGVDLRAVAGRDLADLLREEHSLNDPLRYNEDWGRRQGRTPSCMQALHKGPVLNTIHASF
jgi:hypothetical protein